MQSKISHSDVVKAKAMLAAYERQQKTRKRKFTKPVTKDQASKAVSVVGNYTEQQARKVAKLGTAKAKSAAKSGVKTVKSWFKSKK